MAIRQTLPKCVPDLETGRDPALVVRDLGRFESINPFIVPRPRNVSRERYRRGYDRDYTMNTLELKDLLAVWTERTRIGGDHELFEAMGHILFPKRHEKVFVYLFVWHFRDGLTRPEMMKILKVCAKTINRYLFYVERVVSSFKTRAVLSDVYVPGKRKLIPDEMWRELIAREAAGNG